MKIIKALLKIFAVGIILIAFIAAGIAIYMEFYGKQLLEAKLSDVLGAKLKFSGVSLDLSKYSVNFRGFTIPAEIGFENKAIFHAEKFILVFDKGKFEKEKKIAISEVIIDKGVFDIERNQKGIFNMAGFGNSQYSHKETGIAWAGENIMPIYNFAKNARRLLVKNSAVNFKDYYISQQPYAVTCRNFAADIRMAPENEPLHGLIPVSFKLSLEIPKGAAPAGAPGAVFMEGNAAVYKNKVDTEFAIDTQDIDVMQFLLYFNNYTPFTFYGGEFDSNTKVAMHNNVLNSPTTMVWRRLNLAIDQGRENTSFLEASVKKLVPYLTSGAGEITFDFVIKGSVENPEVGIGPKVKMAIGMSVMDEVGDILQQLQKLKR